MARIELALHVPKTRVRPLHHTQELALEIAARCCCSPSMTVSTTHLALRNLKHQRLQTVTGRNHITDVPTLNTTNVIEVQHRKIGLAAIDTAICGQICADPLPIPPRVFRRTACFQRLHPRFIRLIPLLTVRAHTVSTATLEPRAIRRPTMKLRPIQTAVTAATALT